MILDLVMARFPNSIEDAFFGADHAIVLEGGAQEGEPSRRSRR